MGTFFNRSVYSLLFTVTFFFIIFAESNIYQKPLVYANGLFVLEFDRTENSTWITESENGRFKCQYKYDHKEIKNFNFYENGSLCFSLGETHCNSVKISNKGFLVFTKIDLSSGNTINLVFYSKEGNMLFTRTYDWPQVSGFSSKGDFYGKSTDKKLDVINLGTGEIKSYRAAVEFDISHDGKIVVVSYKNGVTIYSNENIIRELNTGFKYHRGTKISPDKTKFTIADMKNICTYSLPDCKPVHHDRLPENEYLREIKLDNNSLWAGVKYENADMRKGILKTYNFGKRAVLSIQKEKLASEYKKTSGLDIKKFREKYKTENTEFPPIPWPFKPQDGPHNIWNNYQMHISGSDGANKSGYMHNGLDIDVNANQECFAVDTGLVKYHGDLDFGAKYWRIGVGKDNSSQTQTGWLYAHLVQSSINYGSGERIPRVGEHIANIVQWEPQNNVDAHIHFCNIKHDGDPWVFTSNNEWGLTHNPHVSVRPNPDSTAPIIETALSGKSKFAYCRNNLGLDGDKDDYYAPDSASGGLKDDIDIIVKLYDIIIFKEWYQPAFRVYYWIKGIDKFNCWSNYNKLIIDTTLSHIRNHAFDFFLPENFITLSRVIYKVDNAFRVGGWFTQKKSYLHIVTNNNGDSLLNLGEADSCLHTDEFYDGWYRVYVKAFDLAGNFAVDSEDVYFNNGNHDPTPVVKGKEVFISQFYLGQNFPGQFSNFTTIQYIVPKKTEVSLKVFNLSGNEIKVLASGIHKRNKYAVKWDGTNNTGSKVSAGMYIYRLKAGDFVTTRKMQYCK